MVPLVQAPSGAFTILTQPLIKTLLTVVVALLFVFAIVHFTDKAQGSIGYTSQLDLSEPPIAYVQASSSPQTFIKALYSSVTGRKTVNTQNQALGRDIASQKGWIGEEWLCLDNLLGQKESGWDNNAQNPFSSAYGIGEFLDTTWAGTGFRKTSDPLIQIKATYVYITNRYSTPCKALQFWLKQPKGWY